MDGQHRSRWTLPVRVATLLVVGVIAFGAVGSLLVFTSIIDTAVDSALARDTARLRTNVEESLDRSATLARVIAADPAVADALADGSRADLEARSADLLDELSGASGVSQLHVSTATGRSLLRAHDPTRHGDDLTAFRPLVADAVGTGRPQQGLERGISGLSARAVVPVRTSAASSAEALRSGMELVGFVEVGTAIDEAFLRRSLPDLGVAIVPAPSAALEAAGADEAGAPGRAVVRNLPASVALPEDPAALADADEASVDRLVAYDHRRWAIAGVPLVDHAGERAAQAIIATDVADLRTQARLVWAGFGAASALLVLGGGALLALKRRNDRALAAMRHTVGFGNRLSRGLRFAGNEGEALRVMDEGIGEATDEAPARLLLADSSRAHLHVALDRGYGGDREELPTPQRCPATRTGEVQRFTDPDGLDACPFLKRGLCRCAGALEGVRCQPLSIQGSTVGVLQVAAPSGWLGSVQEKRVDDLIQQTGDRISALRAFADTRRQADTDELTGLLNRRSLDDLLVERLGREQPYAVLFADLDHFKDLNDTYGHETGDRALRVFAGVLRSSLRPSDLASRFGGEEFVAFLDDCDTRAAREVADRLRSELAARLADGGVPSFTVSVGVAGHGLARDPHSTEGFDAVLGAADAALLHAKAEGRDRVEVAGETAPATVAEPSPGRAPAGDRGERAPVGLAVAER